MTSKKFTKPVFAALCAVLLASCSPAGVDKMIDSKGEAVTVLPDDPTNENEVSAEEGSELSEAEQEELQAFEEPEFTPQASANTLPKYRHVDPNQLVPAVLLDRALLYYDRNLSRIPNKRYLSIINFSSRSSRKRFFVIDMNTGSVMAMHTAHGTGSDSNHDGYAERFSNVSGSNASSLGYYRAAETYYGKNGYSLRLDGLSTTNSNARRRAVVVHGASYVQDANVIQGRSWGCPAVSFNYRTKLINMIKGGSIIYAGTTN